MKKKILLVDDEADFLMTVKIRLEASGYEVQAAGDGEEALQAMRHTYFDAVLVDILMPKMNGLDFLKEVRKKDKKLPIFILTALSDEARFHEARKLGVSGFLVKTNDLTKELKNITQVLNIAEKYKG